jgi:hypothetical protein
MRQGAGSPYAYRRLDAQLQPKWAIWTEVENRAEVTPATQLRRDGQVVGVEVEARFHGLHNLRRQDATLIGLIAGVGAIMDVQTHMVPDPADQPPPVLLPARRQCLVH